MNEDQRANRFTDRLTPRNQYPKWKGKPMNEITKILETLGRAPIKKRAITNHGVLNEAYSYEKPAHFPGMRIDLNGVNLLISGTASIDEEGERRPHRQFPGANAAHPGQYHRLADQRRLHLALQVFIHLFICTISNAIMRRSMRSVPRFYRDLGLDPLPTFRPALRQSFAVPSCWWRLRR